MTSENVWETFWNSNTTCHADATLKGSVQLKTIWQTQFHSSLPTDCTLKAVDLATGAGSACRLLDTHSQENGIQLDLTCVDYSKKALDNLKILLPSAHTLVADCAALPLSSASTDLVMSQYGIEYAGINAFREAVRILRQGGKAILLTHLKEGAIYKECRSNYDILYRTANLGILLATQKAIADLSKANAGSVPDLPIARHQEKIAELSSELGQIVRSNPDTPAGHFLQHLYQDLKRLFSNPIAIDPLTIHDWCESINCELISYLERMNSMLNSALDRPDLLDIQSVMSENGFIPAPQSPRKIQVEDEEIAWLVSGTRETV